MIARLHTRSDNSDRINGLQSKMLCRDGTRQTGSQVHQIAIVEEHTVEQSGLGVHQGDGAAATGQPHTGVAKEACRDFDRKVIDALHKGTLGVDGAVRVDVDMHDRWHRNAALRNPCEGLLGRCQRPFVKRKAGAQLCFRDNQCADINVPLIAAQQTRSRSQN